VDPVRSSRPGRSGRALTFTRAEPDRYERFVARKKETEAPEPLFGGAVEAAQFLLVAATVLLVALGFSRDVNRVFDVAKATYLKLGGGAALLLWLAWASFGSGLRWRSTRLFAGPVVALVAAVGVSTLLSIDPITSEVGVYERQFGFQGYLACAGLFFATATGLAGRRAAFLGLGLLAVTGGLVGTYAHLQGSGLDPLGFFANPHDKVWSFLGNATFAGNSLALLFPMTVLLAGTAVASTGWDERAQRVDLPGLGLIALGVAVVLGLQVFAGRVLGAMSEVEASTKAYRFVAGASLVFIAGCAALGSQGPTGMRLSERSHRRGADQMLAGAMLACVVGVLLGLFHSRTRAAWVGSAVAVSGGLVLLPWLFSDRLDLMRRARRICWGTLAALLILGAGWATFSPDKYARTVRSIPAAFDPDRTDFGKGQGTRPLLWSESIRVLTRHGETLERLDRDRRDYRQLVDRELLDIPAPKLAEGDWSDQSWREAAVWLFGIGIETYRYAFMSHKSLRLEELDPMTNHDNPHNNYLYLFASLGLLGLFAYLWLLYRLLASSFVRFIDPNRDRVERALAFGIVTSFFSYAVYSIAGFDSIASSVFLYTLLGAASVLFEPNAGAAREPLGSALVRSWKRFRGQQPPAKIARPPVLTAVVFVLVGGMTVRTMYCAQRVYAADTAVVRGPEAGEDPRAIDFQLRRTREAIRINPNESFYRQQLGSLYARKASAYEQRARQAQRNGDVERARRDLRAARETAATGLSALMTALHHAWAPENIFITAFQLHAQRGDDDSARQALNRVFDHSPHLGEIRAQLAMLQLKSGELNEALENCRYAIEASRNSPTSKRTPNGHLVCGRVRLEQGELDAAERHLEAAQQIAPKHRAVGRYLAELERLRSHTATTN